MNKKRTDDVLDSLGKAYELMLERAMESYDEFKEEVKELEEKAEPRLANFIDKARETAVELKELTVDESQEIAAYLKRDLQDAGKWLKDTGNELTDWFGYKTGMAKLELLDLFKKAADKEKVDLAQFEHELEEGGLYHSGQVTGPGTLVCENCGEQLHFERAGRIPPCPKCKGSSFHRQKAA